MTLTQPPRSVRNNNPGNLRSGIRWDGLSAIQSDPEFCVFITPKMGFRALAIDIYHNWQGQDAGQKTITRIINKFAPPSENNSAAYAKAVADMMGTATGIQLNLDDNAQLRAMCRAIAVYEAGGWFFSQTDLDEGIRLARLTIDPPEPAAIV